MKSNGITLGILGSGQLGRMSALAAANLGIKVHIYSPGRDTPAGQVADRVFSGDYGDRKKLRQFAKSVDFVSYEFENIPVDTVRYIKKYTPVYPDDNLLEVSQNRISEKKFLNSIGIPTARWAAVGSPEQLEAAAESMGGGSFVLKTARFGYDGKGQLIHKTGQSARRNFNRLKSQELILEEMIDFRCEISVIVARDKSGKTAYYGPMLNDHKNHILWTSTVPAPVEKKIETKARRIAGKLAREVGLRGVLGLEMFLTKDGRILANEIAPRTHNSGHWTIDACYVSQFEQHVRTVCGLPIGNPARHSNAKMVNLLGGDVNRVSKYYKTKGACIHIYGKREARNGRKMGHVTLLKKLTT